MDYYSTLGVSKSASDKELKQAYKKASMQHHPDRGGDENKFKEINES
jgi:DnaJ-class molecular chaperone